MGYRLGIDLGTTYSAAAVGRGDRVTMATLGLRTPEIPSVIAFADDGEVLIGDAALRRALIEPERVAREFKRRIGDPVPLIIGGVPRSPESMMAILLRQIVERVSEAEGGPPDEIVVTHPAGWGPYKTSQLEQVFQMAEQRDVGVLTEPEAAARHYVAQGRLPADSVIAVFDFGGGTFDASVVRSVDGRSEILGESLGLERLGGVDLDQAVFEHILEVAGIELATMSDDAAHRTALARLRMDCVAAKEALSSDVSASVSVLLPEQHIDVRLVRSQFEDMIRPAVDQSIAALEQAVVGAGIEVSNLAAVLLVGGSSRVPLVSQMVRDRLDCPILVDAHPKHAVALGAALPELDSATDSASVPPAAATNLVSPRVPPPPPPQAGESESGSINTDPTISAAATLESVDSISTISRDRLLLRSMIGAGVMLVIALGTAMVLSRPDGQVVETGASGISELDETPLSSTPTTDASALDAAAATVSTSPEPTSEASARGQELVASLMERASGWKATGFMGQERMLPGDGPLQPPRLLWQQAVNFLVGPVSSDGRAFFAVSTEGGVPVLAAADITSGEPIWTTTQFNPGAVNVTDSLLVVPGADEIRFHDPATGELILTKRLPDEAGEGASINGADLIDGTILTAGVQGSSDGAWAASIDVVTGSTNWTITESSLGVTAANSFLTFGTDGETILLAGPSALVALDAESGAELWRSLDRNSRTIFHIDAGVMLYQPETGSNSGADARTGETLWTYKELAITQWSSDGTNFFGTVFGQNKIQARRLATGDLVWSSDAPSVIGPPPNLVVGTEAVYLVHETGEAVAFRRNSGQLIWSANLEGAQPLFAGQLSLSVGDGYLLVMQDGVLRVYE